MSDSRRLANQGVYPGSFNPPTTAHLAIAEAARAAHRLERIDLTVSTSALAKEDVMHPRFSHRIEVLDQAVAHIDWLEVRITDKQLLAEIAADYGVLIVGADKWWQIQDPMWYGGDQLARDAAMATLPVLAIAPRDGLQTPFEQTLALAPESTADVSSTAAREGRLELMVPAARAFALRTGAWIDPARYDRWIVDPEPPDR